MARESSRWPGTRPSTKPSFPSIAVAQRRERRGDLPALELGVRGPEALVGEGQGSPVDGAQADGLDQGRKTALPARLRLGIARREGCRDPPEDVAVPGEQGQDRGLRVGWSASGGRRGGPTALEAGPPRLRARPRARGPGWRGRRPWPGRGDPSAAGLVRSRRSDSSHAASAIRALRHASAALSAAIRAPSASRPRRSTTCRRPASSACSRVRRRTASRVRALMRSISRSHSRAAASRAPCSRAPSRAFRKTTCASSLAARTARGSAAAAARSRRSTCWS